MIKVLRKIRQNLLMENKTGKYLKYALGEIILVVIGILIALNINNWNENQNNKNQLDLIYKIVQDNLKTDIKNIAIPIKFYEDKEKIYEDILTQNYPLSFVDSINEQNYLECNVCRGRIGGFEPFNAQLKGLDLLKKNINNQNLDELISDDLTDDIIDFYTQYTMKLDEMLNGLISIGLKNFTSYEQYPWYLDYMMKKYNHDSVLYFTQNKLYKNKVATYKLIAIDNYLRDLKGYKAEALQIINRIDKWIQNH